MKFKPTFSHYYEQNRLYKYILFGLVISVLVTVFALSSILYISFERVAMNRVYSGSMSSLSKTSKDVAVMIELSQNLTHQIYRNRNISRLLFPSQPDVFELQTIVAELKNYCSVMPFIDSIYVYNKATGLVYVATNTPREVIQNISDFDDPGVLGLLENYHEYRPFSPIPRKFQLDSSQGGTRYCYTYLAYDWFNRSADLESAVIVNISEGYLQSMLNSGKEIQKDDTIIVDNMGTIMSNSTRFPMMQNLTGDYMQTILKAHEPGFLISEIDQEKSLIVYTAPDSLGWRYIRIVPNSFVTNDIDQMKSNTFVITFLVLLLGLLLSIIASKKLYNPIEKILTATRNNFHTLKQEFLRSILFNRQQYNRQTLYSNFIQFKVDFNPETQYYVALVKIDNYKNFSKAKSRKRINAIKTAIMNMTAEIFSQHFVVEAVDVDDDSICLILNFDDKQETIHENTFIKLFNDARTLIMTSYQISVSIVISDLGYSIDSAHDLFRQAIAASRYRLFAGHGSIIFAEKVLAYAAKDYSYPLEKEKVLIESLMEGKIPEVKSQYMEIMEEVEAHSILALNLVVSRLAFSIDLAVKTIQKNNNIPIQEIPYSLYMLEENFETIAEIHAYFFALFDHVGQTLHEKMNSKHIELCNQIDSVIRSNYMDSNLSLDSIADSLDLSPAHITRVYKRHKLKTILEAISECRMNKAKELLRDTDLPIKEIAQMTGFNYDSYFYTVFRKENGVTPANYRKNVAAQSKTQ